MKEQPIWSLLDVTLAVVAIRLAAIVALVLILTWLPGHRSHSAAASSYAVATMAAPEANWSKGEAALFSDLRLHD